MEDYKQILIDLVDHINGRLEDNGNDVKNIGESVMDISHVTDGELMTLKEQAKKIETENLTFREVISFILERVEI